MKNKLISLASILALVVWLIGCQTTEDRGSEGVSSDEDCSEYYEVYSAQELYDLTALYKTAYDEDPQSDLTSEYTQDLTCLKLSFEDASSLFNSHYMFPQAGKDSLEELATIDISNWDVSSVTNMSSMFYYATTFNRDISNWDVSSVTNMSSMFYSVNYFNQDIGNWDVSSVTNMKNMFGSANNFNQDLSGWDTDTTDDDRTSIDSTTFDSGATSWQDDYKPTFVNDDI